MLPDSGTIPVSRALSAAGPTSTAKMSEGIVVRYEPNGARTELPVDFLAILQGRQPDLDVEVERCGLRAGFEREDARLRTADRDPPIVQNAVVIAIF